jgi:hypothetical protein
MVRVEGHKKHISSRRGRGNVGIPKGFPKSVGRVGTRLHGFPCFPHSVISMACLSRGKCWPNRYAATQCLRRRLFAQSLPNRGWSDRGATALGRGPGQTLPLGFVETSRVLAKVTSEAIPTHPNSRSSPGIDHLVGSGAGRPLRGACSLAGADSSASEGSMLAMTKATDSAAGPEMFSVRFLTDLVSISIPVTCKCAIFLLC